MREKCALCMVSKKICSTNITTLLRRSIIHDNIWNLYLCL